MDIQATIIFILIFWTTIGVLFHASYCNRFNPNWAQLTILSIVCGPLIWFSVIVYLLSCLWDKIGEL